MLYAYVNGEKMLASPGERGDCPLCDGETIARCGEIYVWHWAHRSLDGNCEGGEETDWHRAWKSVFPKDVVEVVINKDGRKKRADLLLPNGWIVEFQNSPITHDEVVDRDKFYGKVLWVYNLTECLPRLRFWLKDEYCTFSWIRPRSYPTYGREFVWDLGDYVYAPKKLYFGSRTTGWGNIYDFTTFIYMLEKWSGVETDFANAFDSYRILPKIQFMH